MNSYSEKNDIESIFPLFSEYESIEIFMKQFSHHAMARSINYYVKRRNKERLELACKSDSCDFYLALKCKKELDVFVLFKSNPTHSCNVHLSKTNSSNICNLIIQNENLNLVSVKQVQQKCFESYQVNVSYQRARKALISEKKSNFLALDNSYSYLQSLSKKFIEHNDIAVIQAEDNENRFKRMYVSWRFSTEFYKNSRNIIMLDGTFLSGSHKGNLLTAVCQDGKNRSVLLAFGIVESENLESWRWFIAKLNQQFNIDDAGTIIFSDRDKGLLSACEEVVPRAYKAHCSRHLGKNLASKFKHSEIMSHYFKAVNTYDEGIFDESFEKIKQISQSCHKYLIDSSPETWSNAKFPVQRYGKTTSNAAESMNSALKQFINQDISSFIISVNNYCMEIVNTRRNEEDRGLIVKSVEKAVIDNLNKGKLLTIKQSTSSVFLVDNRCIVNVNEKTCSCKKYPDLGYPCSHLCSVIYFLKLDINIFISKYFFNAQLRNSYALPIVPLTAADLKIEELLPPIQRRSRGRPKIRRFKSHSD